MPLRGYSPGVRGAKLTFSTSPKPGTTAASTADGPVQLLVCVGWPAGSCPQLPWPYQLRLGSTYIVRRECAGESNVGVRFCIKYNVIGITYHLLNRCVNDAFHLCYMIKSHLGVFQPLLIIPLPVVVHYTTAFHFYCLPFSNGALLLIDSTDGITVTCKCELQFSRSNPYPARYEPQTLCVPSPGLCLITVGSPGGGGYRAARCTGAGAGADRAIGLVWAPVRGCRVTAGC